VFETKYGLGVVVWTWVHHCICTAPVSGFKYGDSLWTRCCTQSLSKYFLKKFFWVTLMLTLMITGCHTFNVPSLPLVEIPWQIKELPKLMIILMLTSMGLKPIKTSNLEPIRSPQRFITNLNVSLSTATTEENHWLRFPGCSLNLFLCL